MNEAGHLEIVTNNPRLTADFAASHGVFCIVNVEGSPLAVLSRAETLLQEGYRLVSAPLPPNIPLMRAPFRSLLLERAERRYDTMGLMALSKARERMETQRAIDASAGPGTDDDFALIDEELLRRTLRDHRLGLALDEGEGRDIPIKS